MIDLVAKRAQVYALKRLARGLASGRGAARQGFALALTGALAALPAVPVAPVLDLLDAALEAPNSMKVTAFVLCLHAWHGRKIAALRMVALLSECVWFSQMQV